MAPSASPSFPPRRAGFGLAMNIPQTALPDQSPYLRCHSRYLSRAPQDVPFLTLLRPRHQAQPSSEPLLATSGDSTRHPPPSLLRLAVGGRPQKVSAPGAPGRCCRREFRCHVAFLQPRFAVLHGWPLLGRVPVSRFGSCPVMSYAQQVNQAATWRSQARRSGAAAGPHQACLRSPDGAQSSGSARPASTRRRQESTGKRETQGAEPWRASCSPT